MNEDFRETSFLFCSNAVFVEELHRLYLSNPHAVDQSWHSFFQNITDNITERPQNKRTAQVMIDNNVQIPIATRESSEAANKLRVRAMVESYRMRAHYLAVLDPLKLEVIKTKHELRLNIEDFGFTNEQLNDVIDIDGEFFRLNTCVLSEFINLLDQTYSQHIAVEFDQVRDDVEQAWLFDQIENQKFNLSKQDQQNILHDLVQIEGFEQYLHTKFPGAKCFSIEGGETGVVALDKAIDMSIAHGVEDVVIGMAHRGRLSTLTKIMRKPYKAVLSEFITGNILPNDLGISGDVKYHIGYSSDRTIKKSKIHLSLADNPSHLEAVNGIVAGKVRAKQDIIKDIERKKILGILIHGDAAFCGQGVVAETLSMSSLKPYNIGGILHFVINNQVGFTANSCDTRSGRYSTEFAKIIGAPILHVNGDDIEAILRVTNIAINYRNKFAKDIVVEIICYRKYGHNEGDEPMYTQAVMYNMIKSKQSVATLYANNLIEQNIITTHYLNELKEQFKLKLDQEYEQAKNYQPQIQFSTGLWSGYIRSNASISTTGVNKSILKELGIKLCQIPKDFPLHPKLTKLFALRETTLKQDQSIDWATAEQLAFATLLNSKVPIRLTGQDSGRGTFSHRHAVLHSQIDNRTYVPLNNLSKNQANFEIANSHLSEYGVLAFEYGYSLVNPQHLVIWEAQFGDFANGAQIIFDQFIASSEIKWLRMSGIVVLLPHGFEGQGPEHSSARLERFLQLAAEDNIQVTYPTTPASFFHLLRRQIYSNIRKPLIIMTPKSLLRHKLSVSNLLDLDEETSFIPVLDEINSAIELNIVTRVILCTGKVYYDLLEMRTNQNISDIVIIRLEQLYPFEKNMVIKLLNKYNRAKEFIWCQEEPKNMGAWNFIKHYLNDCLKHTTIIDSQFQYVGREESASPAAGSLYVHKKQQEQLIQKALKR